MKDQPMPMKLTAGNVEMILLDCLFKEGEDTTERVEAQGVISKFGFHAGRLSGHAPAILELLLQLPEEFHLGKGGGWSFLNACMTAEGEQWGEHRNIEQLLVLGLASGQARYVMPKEMWAALPGGMPYFNVGVSEKDLCAS